MKKLFLICTMLLMVSFTSNAFTSEVVDEEVKEFVLGADEIIKEDIASKVNGTKVQIDKAKTLSKFNLTSEDLSILPNFKKTANDIICTEPGGFGAIRDDGMGFYSEWVVVGYIGSTPYGEWQSVSASRATRQCDRWLGFTDE